MSRKEGILRGTTHSSEKIHTTCGAIVFDDGTSRVRFVYRSVMTTMSWVPAAVFGSEPKLSIAPNFRICYREKSQMTLRSETRSAFGALTAVINCSVDVVAHMWPVELMSNTVTHAMLAEAPRQFPIICEVEKELPKRVWS